MKTKIVAALLFAFMSFGVVSNASAATWRHRHHHERQHHEREHHERHERSRY